MEGGYNEPWHDDDYEDMDSVLIVHTHDGETIAKFLQENLKKQNFNVNVCHITELESRNLTFHATLLLVTPEMVDHLGALPETFRSDIFSDLSKVNAVLVHDHVNMKEKAVITVLQNKLPKFESWKTIPLSNTRSAVMQIIDLMDTKPELPMPSRLLYHLQPSAVTDREKVFILFKSEKKKSDKVVVHAGNREIVPLYRNPYTFAFSPYGLSFGKVQISVSVNGFHEGSTTLTIENTQEVLKQHMKDIVSPIEFFCQVFPLHESQRKHLEDEIDMYNIRKEEQIETPLIGNICDSSLSPGARIDKELPTYLHFGAKFGLCKFCQSLRNSKDFGTALTIRNKDGETPSLLAKRMGYTELSSELDAIMQALQEEQNNTYSVVQKEKRERNVVPPPLPARRTPLNDSMKEDRPKLVLLKRSPTDVGSYSKQPQKAGIWRHSENASQQTRHNSFGDNKGHRPIKSKDLKSKEDEMPNTVDSAFSDPFPSLARSLRK